MADILNEMRSRLRGREYRVFARPNELNLVAVRASETAPGHFADELHVFYAESGGSITYVVLPAVTDVAGWLGCDTLPDGTWPPLLADGQYEAAFGLKAPDWRIEQAAPLRYLFDFNRTALLGLSAGVEQWIGSPSCAARIVLMDEPLLTTAQQTAVGDPKGYEALRTAAGWLVLRDPQDLAWLKARMIAHQRLYGNTTLTVLCDRTRRAAQLRTVNRFARLGLGAASVVAGAVIQHRQQSKHRDAEK